MYNHKNTTCFQSVDAIFYDGMPIWNNSFSSITNLSSELLWHDILMERLCCFCKSKKPENPTQTVLNSVVSMRRRPRRKLIASNRTCMLFLLKQAGNPTQLRALNRM